MKESDEPLTKRDLYLHAKLMRENMEEKAGNTVGTVLLVGIGLVIVILTKTQILELFQNGAQ